MPSSMTHGYFCEDVYDKVDKNIQSKLGSNIGLFKIFGQGPDPYFFYDFHLTPRSRKIYRINRDMQHSKVNNHFIKLINYINEKNYYSNEQIMSYLYGQICHFVLDSTVHPYIIYCTGLYDNKNSSTYKYNGLHEEMEYFIDAYLIHMREHILPRNFKIYKNLFNIEEFGEDLKDCIDKVVYEVYGYENVSRIYYKSIKDMKRFYYIFNYDKLGLKKIVYSVMDLVCGDKFVKKKELSFNIEPNSKLYYLNNDKNIWNHPCDFDEKYDLSFAELYIKALSKACTIIACVDNMLKYKSIDNNKIADLFKNLDYGTGKDCDLNLQCKYFKF